MIRNMFKKLSIIFIFVMIFSFFAGPHVSEAKVDEMSSLYGDYFVPVFHIDLTDGLGLFEGQEALENRIELNKRLAQKAQNEKVSLYDRFGGDIKFIPYYGERNFSLNVVDNIYSNYKEDGEISIGIDDLFFSSDSYFNTEVYLNRPYVLTVDELDNGLNDPRTAQYSNWGVGSSAALGNFYLSIANFIVDFTTFFISSDVYNVFFDVMESLFESDAWTFIQRIVMFLLPVLMIGAVLAFLKQAMNVAKGNLNNSKEGLFSTAISVFVSLAVIFLFLAKPMAFNQVTKTIIGSVDDLFASALSEGLNDEVISSSNNKYVVKAAIWKTAIFQPWCNGMFQKDYEELYTQYETDANKTKYPQSHQDKEDGKNTYDSATLTGDIQIPIGNDTYVRNWAALAWSTQSTFHINADGTEQDTISGFPSAMVTFNDHQLYVDNFRWIDAKLNISPQYQGKDNVVYNYDTANSYKETFVLQGMNAMTLAALTLLFLPLAFKKIFNLIVIIIITVRWIVMSMLQLIKPDQMQHDPFAMFKGTFRPFKNYLWYSLLMYLLITIYMTLAGKGFLQNVVFILFAIMLSMATPPESSWWARMKDKARETMSAAKEARREKRDKIRDEIHSNKQATKKMKTDYKTPSTGLKK